MWGTTGALGGSWPSLCVCTILLLSCKCWRAAELLLCALSGPAGSHCFCRRVFGVVPAPAAFPLLVACLWHGDPIWGCPVGIQVSQIRCSTLGAPHTVRITWIVAQWLCSAAAEKYRNQIAIRGWRADRPAAAVWVERFHFHVLTKNKAKVIKGDSSRRQVLWQFLP